MSYNLKEARTFDEQLALLESRNMLIDDSAAAIKTLQQINYYRFTGYSYLFQKGNNKYYKDTHFESIVKIMEFDSKMRRILLYALEYIEICARTQIAYWFSHNHDKDGGAYYDAANFKNAEHHEEMIAHLDKQIEKNVAQSFVAHHMQKYAGKMPLWCAVELMSFSSLSKLYNNMKDEDKSLIAANLEMDASFLSNWLHCFSVLRNTCAHYGRLYCISYSPPISLGSATLRKYTDVRVDTLFAYIIAMLRFVSKSKQKEELQNSICALIDEYSEYIDIASGLGFPANWETLLFDQNLTELKPIDPKKKQLPNEANVNLERNAEQGDI